MSGSGSSQETTIRFLQVCSKHCSPAFHLIESLDPVQNAPTAGLCRQEPTSVNHKIDEIESLQQEELVTCHLLPDDAEAPVLHSLGSLIRNP